MNRAAIVATSILAFSPPSLAASDAELSQLGDKMSGAFRCSFYASYFEDQKEQQRLFQIGLKTGRDFVEKARNEDPNELGKVTAFLPGASTDFVVGLMYGEATARAYDEIAKYDRDGLPLNKWRQLPDIKIEAELSYRKSNCSLIQ